MVWFQCEDCGENLKKPKLPNHFRICSASKLSCIDCGEMFGQQSVQGHTQCITEAEKYGPKGQSKVTNGSNAKPNKASKQQPDIDINVGLSQRPPWFCSLCNTKATSKQTLLLHAEGKKHRAKARAHHAAKQQSEQTEAATETKVPTENTSNGGLEKNNNVEDPKAQDIPKVEIGHADPKQVNDNSRSSKKRKLENHGTKEKTGTDTSDVAGNGEVIQAEREKADETERSAKKSKKNVLKEDKVEEYISTSTKEDTEKKIKWKKLITSALLSNSDGAVKLKKLRKLVLKALQESGVQEDERQLSDVLEQKINSSSRFIVDGKYVLLAAKD